MTLNRYNDKRHEARITKIGTVYYTFPLSSDVVPGITVDVSNTGASIYTPQPLDEGIEISIRGEGLWNGLKNATVKWVDRINKDMYRVGIAFN